MNLFNHHPMQSDLTFFGFGPLTFWEWLPVLGGCVLVALAVAACIPRQRRLVNPRVFTRLIHRVHDRREQLFSRPPAHPWRSVAREEFLESVRERLRACEILHRDSGQPGD